MYRSTDFIVEEVDIGGQVVTYSPDLLYLDTELERKKPEEKKAAIIVASETTEESSQGSEEEKEKILKELAELFDSSDFASAIFSLYESSKTSKVSDQITHEVTIDDKDHRKRIHLYFKCHFDGRLVTDVVAPQNFFRVSIKSRSGGARPSTYDHRNNQGPDDPKPVPFLEFTLWKDGLDTMEAVQTLSKRLLMPAKSFSYAGTKDRRSVSTQRIVARNAFPAKIAGINKMTGMRMKVSHLRSAEGPLRFGDLSGNRFTVILRNVTAFSEQSFNEALNLLSQNGFINYYGLQRFGRGGGEVSTDSIGRALLAGNYEEACNMILDPRPGEPNKSIASARTIWKETRDPQRAYEAFPFRCSAERAILNHFIQQGSTTDFMGAIGSINRELRLMYVHAVQSLWWNATASERVRRYGLTECVPGDLVIVGDQVVVITEENRGSFSIFNVVIPIVGYSTIFPSNQIGDFLRDITADCPQIFDKSVGKNQLWDLPGGYRPLLQKPTDLTSSIYKYSEADEVLPPVLIENRTESEESLQAVQLSFTLPTSAYATMLLREIFPKNSSTSGDYHKILETK